MPQIMPRGAVSAPVAPTISQAPAAPAVPVRQDLTGQLDRSGGAATPPATEQPNPQADTEARRIQDLATQQARQRAQQRAREQDRARQAELQRVTQERQAEQQELATARALLGRLKTDPYGVMLDQGILADQAAALLVQQPEVGAQKLTVLEQQLAEANQKIERLLNGQTEQQQASREAARVQIRHDVKSAIAADPTLEAMKFYGATAVEAVVALIERTFDEEHYVQDTAEAMAEVEEYLAENTVNAAQSIGKVRSRLTPAEVNAAIDAGSQAQGSARPATPNQPQKTPMRTLSQALVPATQASTTSAQRRQRAILAFQGKLA